MPSLVISYNKHKMIKKGKFLLLDTIEFKTWLFTHSFRRTISFISNHHTFVPDYSNFDGQNHFKLLKGMESFHISNGWGQIAQNITTFPDGSLAVCRSFDIKPTCVKNKNKGGLCIENVGNFDFGKDEMTVAQKETIVTVNALLCSKFSLTPDAENIVYHHWDSEKTCPGTNFFGGNSRQDAAKNFFPLVKNKIENLLTNEPMKGIVKVANNDTLNVRKGPGVNFKTVRALNPEEQINIFYIQNNWFKISNTDEWVNGKFVKII